MKTTEIRQRVLGSRPSTDFSPSRLRDLKGPSSLHHFDRLKSFFISRFDLAFPLFSLRYRKSVLFAGRHRDESLRSCDLNKDSSIYRLNIKMLYEMQTK